MDLQETLEELKTATGRTDISLSWQEITNKDVEEIGKALADSQLTSLTLNLNYNKITDTSTLGKAIEKNSKLTSLELDLTYNQITDISALGVGIEKNNKLTSLSLNLYNNQITDISALPQIIENNSNIMSFILCLSCNQITEKGASALAYAMVKSFAQITLNTDCALIIDSSGKPYRTPYTDLNIALALNDAINHLDLNLGDSEITNITVLAKALENNSKLISLDLYLNDNQITDITALGIGIEKNSKLTSLSLWLNNNQITDIAALGIGIEKNSKLTSLSLYLGNNKIRDEQALLFAKSIERSYAKIELTSSWDKDCDIYTGNNIGEDAKKALKTALELNANPCHREKQKEARQKRSKESEGIKSDDKIFKEKKELEEKIRNQTKEINDLKKRNTELTDKLKYCEQIKIKSDDCFKEFAKKNIKICYGNVVVAPHQELQECRNQHDLCIPPVDSWIIEGSILLDTYYLNVCLTEFQNRDYSPCKIPTENMATEEPNNNSWWGYIVVGIVTFAVGVVGEYFRHYSHNVQIGEPAGHILFSE